MPNHNDRIQEYITDYLSSENPPHYALMLDGAWGTGKTFFIKKIINEITQDPSKKDKILYISLYGINNTNEIWDDIFAQLHPFLSSKPASIVGGILKKFTINIDIYGDDKKDATLNTFIDNFFTKDNTNYSLVFDDLERANVPISNILSYINKFIEHQELKVIIVTNENEILNKKETDEYLRTKEKLIGKTLKITPNIEASFSTFLRQTDLKNKIEQLLLQSNITNIFSARGNANLRVLKNTINNLNFFLKNHKLNIKENIIYFIEWYAIFSIESSLGTIRIEDIEKLDWWTLYASSKKRNEKSSTNLYDILNQYYANTVNNSKNIFNFKEWHSVIKNGYLDDSSIEKMNRPTDPITILYLKNRYSERKIKSVLKEVVENFYSTTFVTLEDLIMTTSLILGLKNEGYVIDNDKDSIEQTAKLHIDKIINNPNIDFMLWITFLEKTKHNHDEVFNILEYRIPKNNINFFIDYLLSKAEFFAEKSAKEFSKKIIELIENDSIYDSLFYDHANKNKAINEVEIPAFIYLNDDSLVKRLLSEDISQNSRMCLLSGLEHLSQDHYTNSKPEVNQKTVDCIAAMVSEIEQEKDKYHGSIRKFIDEFIKTMEEIKTLFQNRIP